MKRGVRTDVLVMLVLCLLGSLLASPAHGEDDVGPRPAQLAVVLDLSGSMNDNDGTGTIKLDGAKEALVSVVQTQAARGDSIGLWTYPGGPVVGGCQTGGWAAPLGEHPVSLTARINSLTAAGGTPTGPALQAVATEMRSDGRQEAVILLVSDGMSNCGPPPCEVAQELVADGFQVTVQAMGFQVDARGREELECIAHATGGAYFDAEDADDLVAKIEQYGVPNLVVSVDAPAHVASGDVARVSVTVSNGSAQTIPGVTLQLQPHVGDASTVFPAVVPPMVPLGNLPANSQRSYTWEMPMGSISKGGTTRLRAAAASSGFASSVTEDFVITALGPEFDVREHTWLSRTVADGSDARILILGDSYSSGEGAGHYHPATNQKDRNMCHRSRHTYLANTELPDAQIVACSGATSSQVVQIGQHDQPPQIHHPLVTDVTTPADVAFMTLGGNDIQFAKILSQCVQGSDLPFNPTLDCDQGWGHTLGTLFLHAEDFRKAYQAVHAAINTPEHIAARDGRQAPLVVLPYPNLVPARKSGPCGLDADELRFAQALVHELNDTIRLAVAQSDNDGIIFASQVRTALGAHGMCTEDPHFNNPTLLGAAPDVILSTWQAQEWGHLDRRGYMDVTRAIQNWSYTQDFDPANPAKPAPTTFPAVNPAPAARATMGQAEAVHMPQGSSLEISGHGYAPGSPLLLTIHSTPRALLNAHADEDGDVHIVAGIPWDIPVGTHQLVLAGLDPELLPVTQTATVSVGAPKPWWLAPAPFVAAGLLGLGLILLLVALLARRSRRRNATPAPPGDSL